MVRRQTKMRVVYVERRAPRRDSYGMGNSMNFMGNMLTLGFGATILGSFIRR
jgi:hypothetical protein